MTVIGPAPIEPEPLRYRFGWVIAWTSLGQAHEPQQFLAYAEHYGAWGTVLGVILLTWSIVFGVAAAAVRPWAWYVVIASPIVAVMTSAIFVARIASTPFDACVGAGGVVSLSLLVFVYFYRRRTLFGAAWRWHSAERFYARLTVREPVSAQERSGFGGLSLLARWLFVASLVLWCIAQQALRP